MLGALPEWLGRQDHSQLSITLQGGWQGGRAAAPYAWHLPGPYLRAGVAHSQHTSWAAGATLAPVATQHEPVRHYCERHWPLQLTLPQPLATHVKTRI